MIDCPPTLSWLTLNALTASDQVIFVVSPGYFELDSIVQISRTISQIQENFNPELNVAGFLFTMSEPTKVIIASLQLIRQTYTEHVFSAVIPRNTDIREDHMNNLDIFPHNPKSASALAYSKIITEFFNP